MTGSNMAPANDVNKAALNAIRWKLDTTARQWHGEHTYKDGWHRWKMFEDDGTRRNDVWLSDWGALRVTDSTGRDWPQRRASLIEFLRREGFDANIFDAIDDKATDAGGGANGNGDEATSKGQQARNQARGKILDGADL